MSTPNRLVTIPFSHYCEKARWALDHAGISYVEEGHLPILSRLATAPLRSRTTPVLITPKQVLRDSTDILAWVDAHPERRPGAALYPIDPGARAAVLGLEELCDERLGPHTRRIGYVHLLKDRALLDDYLAAAPVPGWQRAVVKSARPLVIATMRRALKLSDEGARRSEIKVRAVFEEVERRLANADWLSGERFGAADITFAALAFPLLFPPEYPRYAPPRERIPSALRALGDELAATPAGRHALRCYREHRRVATA